MLNQKPSNFIAAPSNSQRDDEQQIPVVSLENLDNQYLLTIDLPTVPSVANEIIRFPKDLIVQGFNQNSDEQIVFFRLSSVTEKMKIFYKSGKLSMVLPKFAIDI